MEENYRALANAIIVLAAQDYRRILMKLRKHPANRELRQDRAELLRFFRSDYFSILTDIDSDYILNRLEDTI